MERRRFIEVIAGGLLAAPLAAQAQQADRVFRIGVLGHSSASASAGRIEAFRQGLRDLGYVEGKNVALDYRWSEGKQDRLPELAKELVRRKVDVIVTHSVGVLAAKDATTTIPIVMGGDRWRSGCDWARGEPRSTRRKRHRAVPGYRGWALGEKAPIAHRGGS
jgi:putative ABC transport system substrate-binding protein